MVKMRRFAAAFLAVLAVTFSGVLVAPVASAAVLACTHTHITYGSGDRSGLKPIGLRSGSYPTFDCYMSSTLGSPAAIKALQRAYNYCYAGRFSGDWISVDGVYGGQTEYAVRVIQSAEGLVPTDGLYGPATASRLRVYDSNGGTGTCFG